ncbi:MAG: FoF1 ATP synthase subunit gamma [Gammaproteobacteria bacterium]
MTRRRTLEQHRHSLAEIRGIMNSMKTLAYLETRKLARFLDAQQAVVSTIDAAAADLLSFHPDILPEAQAATPVFLLIGADRGFCGDFNRALLRQLESTRQTAPPGDPAVIAIGRKLHTLLDRDTRVVARIDGAAVVEEITAVLNRLADEIISLQQQHEALEVFCIYHGSEDGVVMQRLLPPFAGLAHKPQAFPHPPVLNLTPAALLAALTDQYLFAALHAMLYTSLMMENHHRVTHLEGAVKHLDDQSADLARQSNTLRQEEIIEEIEVILLSAASLGE